jgi:parallel beta-helix repeat protein
VGTTLTASGNYVQGSGVVPCSAAGAGAAQNGIQLEFGAAGKITGNTVIDNIYAYDPTVPGSVCNWDSVDILLWDAAESAGIAVTSNIVGNSQTGIGLYTDTVGTYGDGVSVTGNKVFSTSAFDGIDVCTNGNTITGNTIFASAESGVHLDASCGSTGNNNTVTGNTILESDCAGILDDTGGAGGNIVTPNTYLTVPFPVAYSTSGCTIPISPDGTRAKTGHKFSPKK